MVATEELGDIIGSSIKQQNSMLATQGIEPGTISSYFVFGNFKFRVRIINVLIESRTIGTAFILGHPNNAVLGTSALGAGTMSAWSTVENLNISQSIPIAARIEIAKWLAGESADDPTHIALGTDSTTYSEDDTTLGTEVHRNDITTYNIATNKTDKHQIEIKSTESSFQGSAFRELGLLNAAASGDLFARVIISSLTMANTKEYRITITTELSDESLGNAIMPDAGLNEIRDFLGNGSATAPTHCAWGTGTTNPAAGNTTLEGEQERNAITTTIRTDNIVSFGSILTKTEANAQSITKSGLFNASSSGDLITEVEYGVISKTALFQIYETDRITVL